jgi:hypothetical protein
MSTRAPSRRYDSVQQDWRAFLPETKALFFQLHTRELENSYVMLSVSLDEAIGFRRNGEFAKAVQAIGVTPELCLLLAVRLEAILYSMRQQARHFGVFPNLAPLESANFRTDRGLRAARFSSMLNRVLLSERSQFLHKISALEEIVDAAGNGFVQSVQSLEHDQTPERADYWQTLDACHFDLNTCLRETVVLLKSFLLVLPDEQLNGLDYTIRGLCRSRRPASQPGAIVIPARRMGAVAGK